MTVLRRMASRSSRTMRISRSMSSCCDEEEASVFATAARASSACKCRMAPARQVWQASVAKGISMLRWLVTVMTAGLGWVLSAGPGPDGGAVAASPRPRSHGADRARRARWLVASVSRVMRRIPLRRAQAEAARKSRVPRPCWRCSGRTIKSSSQAARPPSAVLMVKSRLTMPSRPSSWLSTNMRPSDGRARIIFKARRCLAGEGEKSASCSKR